MKSKTMRDYCKYYKKGWCNEDLIMLPSGRQYMPRCDMKGTYCESQELKELILLETIHNAREKNENKK